MSKYHSILFPVFENDQALDYAIDLAKGSNAKLYLLHTYRLNSPKHNIDLGKRTLDESLNKELREKYGDKLSEAGIDFEFRIELGFMKDRIVANVKEHNIDVVILWEGEKRDSIADRLNELGIPILQVQ